MIGDRDNGQTGDAADTVASRKGLTTEQREVVASRWATNPDQALNWAAIPYVNRKAAAMTGATDLEKGFWLHMLDLYSRPDRPVRRVLSLACGLGHQERTLARFRKFEECDAYDISPAALEKAREFGEAEGLHNINYECRDIDDLKLTHQYDIVIAGGVHHIRNLENLFAEVSRSLAPGGFALMYEYVGPSQCQPTARQVEAVNACIRLLPRKYRVKVAAQRALGLNTPGEALAAIEAQRAAAQAAAIDREMSERAWWARGRVPRFVELLGRARAAMQRGDFLYRLLMYLIRWIQPPILDAAPVAMPAIPDAESDVPEEYFWTRWSPMTREQWNAADPSEAVRSDEIIPLLRRYFKTVDVRYTGGSIMQFTLFDIAANFCDGSKETRDLLDMLFKIEEVLVEHDDVPQNYAVIVAKND
jgi:SAM-dependent methyltransferase